jgi:drug/metabolite transporter (DMT)-like permease
MTLRLSETQQGFALALTSAVLWGVSGACAQFVFQDKGITIDWMVTVRLLLAGTMLLTYALWRGRDIWHIWQTKRSAISLLIFGLLGMLAVQYTYFAAIQSSNAATGTVLQYVGPVLIALYFACLRKRWPTRAEAAAVALAFLGTVLLVTHGDWTALQISPAALFWGLASAVALAFYSIQPERLLQKNEATVLVGWGMVIGGLGFCGVSQPWEVPGVWDVSTLLGVMFIVLFGTLFAFYGYLAAVQKIGPETTSLLACAEPLSATVMAVLWLKVPFALLDWLGSACIVATIFLLSRSAQDEEKVAPHALPDDSQARTHDDSSR